MVESGRPDALALEGFGWIGGDFGGPSQDLGEQVEQVCSFVLVRADMTLRSTARMPGSS